MKSITVFVLAALAFAIVLAVFVSPYASEHPDGLEWVAEQKGFIGHAGDDPAWKASPVPDYTVPGIDNPSVATGIAGLIGTIVTFAVAFAAGKIISTRSRNVHERD